MTTPEEQKDLDALKAATAKIEHEAFECLRMFVGMSEAELKPCGHKSVGAALEWTTKDALSRIKKETNKFLAKWPD